MPFTQHITVHRDKCFSDHSCEFTLQFISVNLKEKKNSHSFKTVMHTTSNIPSLLLLSQVLGSVKREVSNYSQLFS